LYTERVTAQLDTPDATDTSSHQHQASPTSLSPSWQQPDHPTAHDRFRQIFRNHWDRWCDQRLEAEVPPDQRAYVRKIVQRLTSCRDPNAGYARYVCPGCQYERYVPFSCKTRFCPSCGKVRVDNWVNDIARDLLKVPHFHITLTTDDLLWSCFLDDRSRLKILLQTAAQVVRELVEELHPGVRIGMIYTTHTYGRDLGFKPHVHLVMTKGGLKDGKWVEIDTIPAARLAAKWRYLLCKHLRQARPHDPELRKAIDQGYCEHRGYQVHTDSFYPEGLEVARYIGRYLGHPPIATSHIVDCDAHNVTYWYIDTATGLRQTVTCSALDFISRMVPHIPPKGMQTVRYAGLYARNVKRKLADIARVALEAVHLQAPLFGLEPMVQSFQHLDWRERIKASFGYDPLECPHCGCTMQLAEIWEPKRGHIWMKRWINTHRMRKAARLALERIRAEHHRYRQLEFNFDT
jgi:hypothetical protein